MAEYETPGRTIEKYPVLESIKEIPAVIDEHLPTMDRGLDEYFDRNFPAIISEWGLVTSIHLKNLERRLDRVHGQIDLLEKNRNALEKRAAALKKELRGLEGQ
ncbi:MAG: hypothetical protein NQU46_05595 [Methanolinea sp.]|nr:hypothetical protein [Methanolinea sp.]